MDGTHTVEAGALERWTRDLLEARGMASDAAATIAETLVDASLRGVDSHGVARIPIYLARYAVGAVNLDPHPSVVRRDGATAVVDADHGPGQVTAVFATDLSIELAREYGIGMVSARGSAHTGAMAYYSRRVAAAGMIGITLTNAEPLVVPFGGREPALGTNPICLAAPTPDGIFDLDLATSQVAYNKIVNAKTEGRPLGEGWAIDAQGRPTTDPETAAAGLPLGGYKGTALAVLVEVLSAILSGAGMTHGVGEMYGEDPTPQEVGHFHLAIDPERTVGRERFATRMAALLAEITAGALAEGSEEILHPGQKEERTRAARERDGVPLEPALYRDLVALSEELGVEIPAGP